MTELTSEQKIDQILKLTSELKEGFTVLCNATQDIVDKMDISGLPKRPTAAQTPPTQLTGKTKTIDEVRMWFPEEVEAKLSFDLRKAGTVIEVKPKEFLGSETFAKTAQTIKANGGQYISAGRESHFEIPVKGA